MQAGEAEDSGGQKHAAIERGANRRMARVHDRPIPDSIRPVFLNRRMGPSAASSILKAH
jgi:hypothetical protein